VLFFYHACFLYCFSLLIPGSVSRLVDVACAWKRTILFLVRNLTLYYTYPSVWNLSPFFLQLINLIALNRFVSFGMALPCFVRRRGKNIQKLLFFDVVGIISENTLMDM